MKREQRVSSLNAVKSVFLSGLSYTQKDLARTTGFSIVSVSKTVDELCKSGFIRRQNSLDSTGGRKPIVYVIDETKQLIATVMIREIKTVMTMELSVVTLQQAMLVNRFSTDLDVESIRRELKGLCREYPAIKGVVIGIPGVEIQDQLEIMDITGLLQIRLRPILEEDLERPVRIINDVNAALVGFGTRHTSSLISALYFPEGYYPGSGLLVNHTLFLGRHGISGEIHYLFPWIHTTMSAADFKQNLAYALSIMISMYNPEVIVVYASEGLLQRERRLRFIREVKASLSDVFKAVELPDIRVEESFSQDFKSGLFQSGLTLIRDELNGVERSN